MTASAKRALALAGLALVSYLLVVRHLTEIPRVGVVQEMQVALPRFAQVAMTGGDRFLAANIATWRSLVASTANMQRDNYVVQGRLQSDAAWLNPFHEDNYYIAAAILPWAGELDAAQFVLKRASAARPYDWQPAFYYAFNLYQIQHKPVEAAEFLRKAAPSVASEDDRNTMENLAAVWFEKGYEPSVANTIIKNMASGTRPGAFRKYLLLRAQRLEQLAVLRDAAQRYRSATGRSPANLDDLLRAGLIKSIPVDPFGFGFGIDQEGNPILHSRPQQAKK